MNTQNYEQREQEHKRRLDIINANLQESISEIKEFEDDKKELEEFFEENPGFVKNYENNVNKIEYETKQKRDTV